MKSDRIFWGGFIIFLVVQCLPFFLIKIPPLPDYPAHLARVYILGVGAQDLFLSRYYVPAWDFLPNLGFDIPTLIFFQFLPIYAAGKATLLLTVVLLSTGVVAVNIALWGRPRLFVLVAFFFVYSVVFSMGFIALLIGFGLALHGIALWLRLRTRCSGLLVLASLPLAAAIYLAHLFALGTYVLTIGGLELSLILTSGQPLRQLFRSTLCILLQIVTPCLLFLTRGSRVLAEKHSILWANDLAYKLQSVLLAPIRNYSESLDLVTFAILIGLFGLGLIARRVRIVQGTSLTLLLLCVAAAIMPAHIASGDYVDLRLPVFLALFGAACFDWQAVAARELQLLAVALVALFLVRTGVVANSFIQGSAFYARLEAGLADVPKGARIASTIIMTPKHRRTPGEWWHADSLQVIDRSAFVPHTFVFPGQQPLRFAPAFRDREFPPEYFEYRPGRNIPQAQMANIDYWVMINPDDYGGLLPAGLTLVHQTSEFWIFRIYSP